MSGVYLFDIYYITNVRFVHEIQQTSPGVLFLQLVSYYKMQNRNALIVVTWSWMSLGADSLVITATYVHANIAGSIPSKKAFFSEKAKTEI